jgi:RNA polymerase sigma factor (sigma-70 family)
LFVKNTIPTFEALIKGCLKADRNAQHNLYALLAKDMFIVCQRYSLNREDAEDSLQEGFIKVFDNIQQFRNEGPFQAWVRKIMVNCSLQKLRSRPILYAIPHINIDDVDFKIDENITSMIEVKELVRMMQDLPPACKMVFNLYVFEGLKHKEIADLLGITNGTSKSNLFDARKILQKMIIAVLPDYKKKVNQYE